MKNQSTIFLVLAIILLLYVVVANDFLKFKQFFIYGVESFKEKMESGQTNDTIKMNIPILNNIDDEDTKQHPGYCFIGDNDGSRHCVELEKDEKCVSGQVYKHKEICINPDLRF